MWKKSFSWVKNTLFKLIGFWAWGRASFYESLLLPSPSPWTQLYSKKILNKNIPITLGSSWHKTPSNSYNIEGNVLFFFSFYRFSIYQQAKIELFIFDITSSKQDFANIHISLKWNLGKILLTVLALSSWLSKMLKSCIVILHNVNWTRTITSLAWPKIALPTPWYFTFILTNFSD